MACWICTFGSAYSSTLDENSAIMYFQAFTNGLAICPYLRMPRCSPRSALSDTAAGALSRPIVAPHPTALPPRTTEIGDDPDRSVRGDPEARAAGPPQAATRATGCGRVIGDGATGAA